MISATWKQDSEHTRRCECCSADCKIDIIIGSEQMAYRHRLCALCTRKLRDTLVALVGSDPIPT